MRLFKTIKHNISYYDYETNETVNETVIDEVKSNPHIVRFGRFGIILLSALIILTTVVCI